jgi:hypothetical protein
MSATIHKNPAVLAYPQPDFQARRDSDNSGWTATQTFRIVKGTLNDAPVRAFFAINTPATILDPSLDSIWSFLRLRNVDIQTTVGGWQDITANFGGIPTVDGNGNPIGDLSEFQVTYAMRGVTGDVPLQEHPKFKALAESERVALGKIASGEYGYGPEFNSDEPNRTYFFENGNQTMFLPEFDPIETEDAKTFAILFTQGETSYKGAGFTWSKRWTGTEPITAAQLNLLGKIVANPPGNPPTPSGDRDWLLAYANIEQQGEINANPTFTNELVFELSEPGGWDTFLHT